jgi:hypothetical protein
MVIIISPTSAMQYTNQEVAREMDASWQVGSSDHHPEDCGLEYTDMGIEEARNAELINPEGGSSSQPSMAHEQLLSGRTTTSVLESADLSTDQHHPLAALHPNYLGDHHLIGHQQSTLQASNTHRPRRAENVYNWRYSATWRQEVHMYTLALVSGFMTAYMVDRKPEDADIVWSTSCFFLTAAAIMLVQYTQHLFG